MHANTFLWSQGSEFHEMGNVLDVYRIKKEEEEGGYIPFSLHGSWEQLEVVKADNTIYVEIRVKRYQTRPFGNFFRSTFILFVPRRVSGQTLRKENTYGERSRVPSNVWVVKIISNVCIADYDKNLLQSPSD